MSQRFADLPALETATVRLEKAYYLIGLALDELTEAYLACRVWATKNPEHPDLTEVKEGISAICEEISKDEFIAYNVLQLVAQTAGDSGIRLTYSQDKRLQAYMGRYEEMKAERAA